MTKTQTTILPLIHLNGSGKQNLCSGYYKAYTAAHELMDAMAEIGFHARDYYPISSTAFYEAQTQRTKHMDNLRDLIQYLEDHVSHLS